MVELTDRQIKLLKVIIEEYIETAEPVGSEMLDKKHNLGVSPATIRNEMVRLTQNGFLKQPHTSAGRVPTPMALKFYIQNLMQQKEMSVTDEVSVKEKVWDYRTKTDKLLREATKALAEKTHTLALATTNEGDLYYTGAANLLDMLEFYDMITTKSLLTALDQFDFWWNIFDRAEVGAPYHVVFGEELGRNVLSNCGMVYALVNEPKLKCAICIVGPNRLNFPYVIPVVSYFGHLIDDIAKNWG
jgi:transcriptional regulator of heat shock response